MQGDFTLIPFVHDSTTRYQHLTKKPLWFFRFMIDSTSHTRVQVQRKPVFASCHLQSAASVQSDLLASLESGNIVTGSHIKRGLKSLGPTRARAKWVRYNHCVHLLTFRFQLTIMFVSLKAVWLIRISNQTALCVLHHRPHISNSCKIDVRPFFGEGATFRFVTHISRLCRQTESLLWRVWIYIEFVFSLQPFSVWLTSKELHLELFL